MSFLNEYSKVYDLLYQDKDYQAEAHYIVDSIEKLTPRGSSRNVLEIGSGTGKHAQMLTQLGWQVTCVEPSEDMARIARAKGLEVITKGMASLDASDFGGKFDTVVALFHVLGYAAVDSALEDLFRNAHEVLEPGGLFLFDVWHAPAVVNLGMELRVKRVRGASGNLVRIATPHLDVEKSLGTVHYEIFFSEQSPETFIRIEEAHTLKFFHPDEISQAAKIAGFEIVLSEEFLSKRELSDITWGAAYLLRKGL